MRSGAWSGAWSGGLRRPYRRLLQRCAVTAGMAGLAMQQRLSLSRRRGRRPGPRNHYGAPVMEEAAAVRCGKCGREWECECAGAERRGQKKVVPSACGVLWWWQMSCCCRSPRPCSTVIYRGCSVLEWLCLRCSLVEVGQPRNVEGRKLELRQI